MRSEIKYIIKGACISIVIMILGYDVTSWQYWSLFLCALGINACKD